MVRTLGEVGQELGGTVGQVCPSVLHLCDTNPHGRGTKNRHLPESCMSMQHPQSEWLIEIKFPTSFLYLLWLVIPSTLSPEKAMAPHSSPLAWKIPWTEEPGRLQSMGSLEGRTQLSNFTFTFHFDALENEMATHSSVLAWRIPGMGEPSRLPSMGSHRVRHD